MQGNKIALRYIITSMSDRKPLTENEKCTKKCTVHVYFQRSKCISSTKRFNKYRKGEKREVEARGEEGIFSNHLSSESAKDKSASLLCESFTGRYPSRGCFLKYRFERNLFLNTRVKSRTSSPEVVCNEISRD